MLFTRQAAHRPCILGLVLAAGLLAACEQKPAPTPAPTPAPAPVIPAVVPPAASAASAAALQASAAACSVRPAGPKTTASKGSNATSDDCGPAPGTDSQGRVQPGTQPPAMPASAAVKK